MSKLYLIIQADPNGNILNDDSLYHIEKPLKNKQQFKCYLNEKNLDSFIQNLEAYLKTNHHIDKVHLGYQNQNGQKYLTNYIKDDPIFNDFNIAGIDKNTPRENQMEPVDDFILTDNRHLNNLLRKLKEIQA